MLIFLNTIGALQLFTEPLILSYFETGAVSANYTPTLYLYNTAIAADQTNLAAAGAVILGLVIVVISTASLLFRRRRGEFLMSVTTAPAARAPGPCSGFRAGQAGP